jgi:hypothetical protein
MLKAKFDFKQFEQYAKGLENAEKEFDKFLSDFLLKQAVIALRLVRPNTPVDTGTLRRSWGISNIERDGNKLKVYLVNPMEYASFMEEGFTYQTKDGERRFEGFHMAEIALTQVREQMPDRFSAAFKTWFSKLERSG